jgi:hypothetical protein
VKPNGNNILVAYQKAEKAGDIHLPGQARSLDFVVVNVLEVGPEVKDIEKGDRIIIAIKALINGERGMDIEGRKLYFTQSNLVVGRVFQNQ